MPEFRGLEEIYDVMESSTASAVEATARATAFGWVGQGVAAVVLATALILGSPAEVCDGLRSRATGPTDTRSASYGRATTEREQPVTVASAEIARNIRERAKLAGRHLVQVASSEDDGPDYAWL
jgi:hypothetical protein